MSPKNPTPNIHLGIDVAKLTLQLDSSRWDRLAQVDNSPKGHRKILNSLQKQMAQGRHPHVILEATGGYERALVDALHQAQIPVTVAHPLRVRRFAQAEGLEAKTDALDASVLSRFGQAMKPAASLPLSKLERQLTELSQRRSQLLDLLVQEKNRAESFGLAVLRTQSKRVIRNLEKEIEKIDQLLQDLVARDKTLCSKIQRLCQIQGVGSCSAIALLAAMPELGSLDRRQAAALAGLAPRNRDSGNFTGKRSIGGGRAQARRALYMAALSASRCNPILQPFYQRLRSSGKPFKVALAAVMRRLLIVLNHSLKYPDFSLA